MTEPGARIAAAVGRAGSGRMIFRSPYPEIEVPDVALDRFVLAQAAERGGQPALIDGPSGRTLTYAELAAGVERVAAGLAARGLKPGEGLRRLAPTSPPFPPAALGAAA